MTLAPLPPGAVELRFTPLPANVRTARMLAVAIARRAGLPESIVDEVRLAVGEAASRAVGVHRHLGIEDKVAVTLHEDDRGFEVVVVDLGDPDEVVAADREVLARAADEDEVGSPLPPGLDLAVVSGFVDEMQITPWRAPQAQQHDRRGTALRLRWKR